MLIRIAFIGCVPWTMHEYLKELGGTARGKVKEAREIALKGMFPPGPDFTQGEVIREPTIIMDRDGNILVWYLPGVLSRDAEVQMSWSLTNI